MDPAFSNVWVGRSRASLRTCDSLKALVVLAHPKFSRLARRRKDFKTSRTHALLLACSTAAEINRNGLREVEWTPPNICRGIWSSGSCEEIGRRIKVATVA